MSHKTDEELKETTLISDPDAYNGGIFRIESRQVELADGTKAPRQIVHHAPAVAVLAIDEDENVTLVRQYRAAIDRVTTELPAGKVDSGEEPEDAAMRELKEECGLVPKKLDLIQATYSSPGFTDEVIYLYLAENCTQTEATPDVGEFLDVISVPYDEVLEACRDGRIQDAKTVAAVSLHQNDVQDRSKRMELKREMQQLLFIDENKNFDELP